MWRQSTLLPANAPPRMARPERNDVRTGPPHHADVASLIGNPATRPDQVGGGGSRWKVAAATGQQRYTPRLQAPPLNSEFERAATRRQKRLDSSLFSIQATGALVAIASARLLSDAGEMGIIASLADASDNLLSVQGRERGSINFSQSCRSSGLFPAIACASGLWSPQGMPLLAI